MSFSPAQGANSAPQNLLVDFRGHFETWERKEKAGKARKGKEVKSEKKRARKHSGNKFMVTGLAGSKSRSRGVVLIVKLQKDWQFVRLQVARHRQLSPFLVE